MKHIITNLILFVGYGLLFCQPAQASLLVHYPFTSGTGTTVTDTSGNNHDASLSGASWAMDRFGISGAAVQTASGDWVDPPNAPLKPTEMTVAAWVYVDAYYSGPAPVWSAEKGLGSIGFHSRMQVTSSGKLRMEAIAPHGSTGYRSTTSAATLKTGEWIHVAGTYDGISTAIYINGAGAGSTNHGSYSALNTDATIPVGIGHLEGWSSQWFLGRIDDFRLYDSALSATDIATLAAIPEGSSVSLLLGAGAFFTVFGLSRRGRPTV